MEPAVKKLPFWAELKSLMGLVALPGFWKDRTDVNSYPLDFVPSEFPIPALDLSQANFDIVLDEIMMEIAGPQKSIYVSWSGGIDSTALLAGLLKHRSANHQITVLLSKHSINENPYFFDKFIRPNFKICDINEFRITPDSMEKDFVVLDGECGNQLNGSTWIATHHLTNNTEVLDMSWRDLAPEKIVPGTPEQARSWLSMVVPTLDLSPVEIKSVYDILWWANFCFKFQDVIYRKVPLYTTNLDRAQREKFFKHNLIRPFSDIRMQQWALNSLDQRRECRHNDLKYFPKKYIFDVDKNPYYFREKTEEMSLYGSLADISPVIAIDSDWDLWDMRDAQKRKQFLDLVSHQAHLAG